MTNVVISNQIFTNQDEPTSSSQPSFDKIPQKCAVCARRYTDENWHKVDGIVSRWGNGVKSETWQTSSKAD